MILDTGQTQVLSVATILSLNTVDMLCGEPFDSVGPARFVPRDQAEGSRVLHRLAVDLSKGFFLMGKR